jgi:DNA repair photolyase
VNDFVEAGYEVHLNFSPVIVTPGWQEEWIELFDQIDAALSPQAKDQLAAEVIFLTHNQQLHEVNLGWHPRAEEILWRPELQETKRSSNGFLNVRYTASEKRGYLETFLALAAKHLPYCRIRYAF